MKVVTGVKVGVAVAKTVGVDSMVGDANGVAVGDGTTNISGPHAVRPRESIATRRGIIRMTD